MDEGSKREAACGRRCGRGIDVGTNGKTIAAFVEGGSVALYSVSVICGRSVVPMRTAQSVSGWQSVRIRARACGGGKIIQSGAERVSRS